MTRELLILRHAKSSRTSRAPTDFQRPLASRGQRDARAMGRFLADERLVPDHVLASPATRTRATVRAVRKALGLDKHAVHLDPRIYEASRDTLLAVLATVPTGARRVLLVGHEPSLSDLVRFLVPDVTSPADGKLMPTGALARIAVSRPFQTLDEGSGRLVSITRPHRARG